MKLSELTFQVVKNVKYLEDAGFNYNSFIEQEFDGDQDYANSINNAMTPINEAIHRLSDRNKIAFKIIGVGEPQDYIVNFNNYCVENDIHIKKIKCVFYRHKGTFKAISFRENGKNEVFIENLYKAPLFIQFIEDIPYFKLSDIYNTESDIDLSTKGISETMCDYIIEYAQGKLQEPIAPELANMHVTRAEQYFDDLEEQQTMFSQSVVHNKYGIGK